MCILLNPEKVLEIGKNVQRQVYELRVDPYGFKYVTKETAASDRVNFSDGNSKTGPALTFSLPIPYTCRADCECRTKGRCYGCSGCYNYGSNQVLYTENLNFFNSQPSPVFVAACSLAVAVSGCSIFRWFGVGDLPNRRFLECMVEIANQNPGVKFWAYTKKYNIVNSFLDDGGDIPENLVVIFSHWLNDDGTFFPMENPHKQQTSEFIPLGQEERAKLVDHICPCSDPNSTAHCSNCPNACYNLKRGQSMALLEHSTARTKQRDTEIKAAKAQKNSVTCPPEWFNK